jgi:hypothetical protein
VSLLVDSIRTSCGVHLEFSRIHSCCHLKRGPDGVHQDPWLSVTSSTKTTNELKTELDYFMLWATSALPVLAKPKDIVKNGRSIQINCLIPIRTITQELTWQTAMDIHYQNLWGCSRAYRMPDPQLRGLCLSFSHAHAQVSR